LVFGKEVTLQSHSLDKYGRTIADVHLPDRTNVNHALVKEGWCWRYQKYAAVAMAKTQGLVIAVQKLVRLISDPGQFL
jgi:endonuclease YncB( thermonuclease family)